MNGLEQESVAHVMQYNLIFFICTTTTTAHIGVLLLRLLLCLLFAAISEKERGWGKVRSARSGITVFLLRIALTSDV